VPNSGGSTDTVGSEPDDGPVDTTDDAYAERLVSKETARWKQRLDVQAPYRWNLRRQHLGRTLDVGCGIGRNLVALEPGSVGVDHNARSIEVARERGCEAYTVDEFTARDVEPFDSLLLAHVLEHMTREEGVALVESYLPYLRDDARVMFVVPQEAGYASDPTHVHFVDEPELRDLSARTGFVAADSGSFPFPRPVGRWFTYNETYLTGRRAG
jgi:SAM-dependent methyltransferase